MTKTSPQARTSPRRAIGASRGIPENHQDTLDQNDDWIVPVDEIDENDGSFLLTEDDLDGIIAIARYDEAPLGDFNFLTRDGCYRNGKPLYSAH